MICLLLSQAWAKANITKEQGVPHQCAPINRMARFIQQLLNRTPGWRIAAHQLDTCVAHTGVAKQQWWRTWWCFAPGSDRRCTKGGRRLSRCREHRSPENNDYEIFHIRSSGISLRQHTSTWTHDSSVGKIQVWAFSGKLHAIDIVHKPTGPFELFDECRIGNWKNKTRAQVSLLRPLQTFHSRVWKLMKLKLVLNQRASGLPAKTLKWVELRVKILSDLKAKVLRSDNGRVDQVEPQGVRSIRINYLHRVRVVPLSLTHLLTVTVKKGGTSACANCHRMGERTKNIEERRSFLQVGVQC